MSYDDKRSASPAKLEEAQEPTHVIQREYSVRYCGAISSSLLS